MAERGRKSSASLSVIPGGIVDKRPDPPADLTEEQVNLWRETVAHEPADMFSTAALQQLLKDYCRHSDSASRLTKVIDGHLEAGEESETSLKDLDRLMKMRDRETKAAADKATKLRLTNQSRYTPKAAATAAKNAGQATKPWAS